jgi:hypothetical protein
MYFLLQAKGLNDNGYLLIKVTNLTTNHFEHLVKLASALVNETTCYIQSMKLTKYAWSKWPSLQGQLKIPILIMYLEITCNILTMFDQLEKSWKM